MRSTASMPTRAAAKSRMASGCSWEFRQPRRPTRVFVWTSTTRAATSSLPVKDNAIYELADALGRLEKYEFPVRLNQVSGTFFERLAAISSGQLASDLL